MAWTQRIATDYKDCLAQVRAFTQKEFTAGVVTPGGGNTGDGVVYGVSASETSVAETWTLAATSATTFSVTGSVSGAQTAATVGEPYSIDKVSFIITEGDIAFDGSESFTFAITASTPEWIEDRWDPDYDGAGGYELIQHGIGAGTDEIYVGYNTKSNDSTYWNWSITGLTGFVPHGVGAGDEHPIETQPGYHPFYDCMNNDSFVFTCIFTSRHIKVIANVDASYDCSSYVGFLLPHATPSQWTYPMFCGGSATNVAQLIGGGEDDHTCYWGGDVSEESGSVLDMSTWKDITKLIPRNYGTFQNFRPRLMSDRMELHPAVPIVAGTAPDYAHNVYGALEGVYYPTPYVPGTGLLTTGSVIASDDRAALCFKDVHRAGAGNVIAMDLMGDI